MLPPPAPLHLLQDLLSKTSKWALSKKSKRPQTRISSGQQPHAASVPLSPTPQGHPSCIPTAQQCSFAKRSLQSAKQFLRSDSCKAFLANHWQTICCLQHGHQGHVPMPTLRGRLGLGCSCNGCRACLQSLHRPQKG